MWLYFIKIIRQTAAIIFVLLTFVLLPIIAIGWLIFGNKFFNACNNAYTEISRAIEDKLT